MTFQNHSVKVDRTAHYSTYGHLSKQTEFTWFVLHGYGQLARKIIRKFDFLDPDRHFVVAPEGLNRFYWHGNNEPVAGWMTREDRYDEIEDFTNYLDDLYHRYTDHTDQKVVKLVFGFSQGCATAWRWLHARQPNFDFLINWAGWIPEDISYLHLADYLGSKRLITTYGDQDHFITEEVASKMQMVVESNRLSIETRVFSGGHKIPRESLQKLYQECILAQPEANQ